MAASALPTNQSAMTEVLPSRRANRLPDGKPEKMLAVSRVLSDIPNSDFNTSVEIRVEKERWFRPT